MITRVSFSLGAAGLTLLSAMQLSAREPTELEQYFLELVNRARADPDAEVSRLSAFPWDGNPNLNEGLPSGTISNTPKPPLAFNPLILDAASDYADLLLAKQEFGHNYGSTTPSGRMTAAGYDFTAPSGASENLAWSAKSPTNPLDASAVEHHHRVLFIDSSVAGRGHRTTLMDASLREAGIAIRQDANGISTAGRGFIDILSTQKFAYSAGRAFVTGVIFNDLDRDGFFTPDAGEAIGGARIEVQDSGGKVVATGTGFASGGYGIDLGGKSRGKYVLQITEASGKTSTAGFSFDGSTNVKVDITGGDSGVLQKRELRKQINQLKRKLGKAKAKTRKQNYRKQLITLKKKLRSL